MKKLSSVGRKPRRRKKLRVEMKSKKPQGIPKGFKSLFFLPTPPIDQAVAMPRNWALDVWPRSADHDLMLIDLVPMQGSELVLHDPRFFEGVNAEGIGIGSDCSSCFARKGLKFKGVEHAEDCLINVPPEHQARWRQGRNDLIELYENDNPPLDDGQDLYYQMGRACTIRNLSEILSARNKKQGSLVLRIT